MKPAGAARGAHATLAVIPLVASGGDGMTQTDIREQRSSGPRSEGEKICHIVEHHNPDSALCGKDVTGYPWNPPWPMCGLRRPRRAGPPISGEARIKKDAGAAREGWPRQ
jgi:hypothetical protein